ncbi:GP88 family protein [Jannaschia sp. KMU-145]|uniref:GP88 family protein n=1 Tax=Jannaschia halovivens TaxID=3388667 RepID=UPI00396B05E5
MSNRSRSRIDPSSETIRKRKSRLEELAEIQPLKPKESKYQLELGNKKIGFNSEYYSAVFAWNIPPAATCPGRSNWCIENCYNGDDRPDTYDLKTWRQNWWGATNEPEVVKEAIVSQLRGYEDPTALRIHSSGDFFSNAYIQLWCDIVNRCPRTSFWAYTRSWTECDLKSDLEVLRSRNNMQLFASWDETMPAPPDDWRVSVVDAAPIGRKRALLDCPEQYDLSREINCASCRYCLLEKSGDVFFALH